MSRVTIKEWYRRVNACWPAEIPELTAPEAVRAGRKLYRFVLGRTFKGDVKITSGRRYSYIRSGTMFVNPTGHTAGTRHSGWTALVHDLAHYFDNRLNPHTRPHAKAQAIIEMNMIKEVVRRGWLDGRLKDKPKPAPVPFDKAAVAAVERAAKYLRVLERLKRWETKAKRAKTAIAKLNRARKYYERTGVSA